MPLVSNTKNGFISTGLYPFIIGITGCFISDDGNNIVKIKSKDNARLSLLVSIVGNKSACSLMYIYRDQASIRYKNLAGFTAYDIKYKLEDDHFNIYIGNIQNWGKATVIPFTLDIVSIEAISEYDADLTDAVQG